ncbi:hypothetical protein R5R35_012166 [Gryllus longicercus]|uniref:RING-type domain-containing protein n=1 Tax=Gryllus longicercus TaxID=2509291 RepID=A0AAN9WF02_9ORTH
MSHEPMYFNVDVNMEDENFQDLLPHENYVKSLESKPEDNVEIEISHNVLDTDQLVCISKSDGEGSIDITSSTNPSLFVSSSNVSESSIGLVSDALNNVNNEDSDSKFVGRNESNGNAIIHQFGNPAAENVDDDCYVVASFKTSTPIKNTNHETDKGEQSGVSLVECVDLTQDEPEETKFQDSLANEFTKDTRLCILLDVIPDADPDFLMRKVNEFKTDDDLQLFVLNALETQSYPKIGTVENILSNETTKIVGRTADLLNEDISRYNFDQPLDYSTSQKRALTDDNTSDFADVNSTISNSSGRRENIFGPIVMEIEATVSKVSQMISSFDAAHTSRTQELPYPSYPLAAMNMQYHSLQRDIQPRITVMGAKPHTVTSQEASNDHTASNIPQTVTSHAQVRYPGFPVQVTSQEASNDRTASNIPQTVTSHAQVRYPGFPVQDLRVSQPGVERLGTPRSTYIPTHNFIPFTQTENNTSANTAVNVPAHPVPPPQIIAPVTRAPRATLNTVLPPRPVGAHMWTPLNINIFNPIDINNAARVYQEYRRHRRNHLFNVPHYLAHGMIEDLVGSLSDFPKAKDENPRFKLLSDILIWADRKFLRSEASKLKNDDDVEKFLIRAIANEKLWNKCVVATNSAPKILPGSASDNKYKILLELLPDANPTFLKQECAKLTSDEEVHEFAMRLGREQTYPKRRSKNVSKSKGIKRKHDEISEPETVDPKYQTLLDMLPDADPEFLLQESKVLENPDDLQKFVLKAVEEKTYPKRDQFLERQEYQKQWKKYIEEFNIKEFLKVIPNPVKFFYIDKVNSKTPLNMPGKFLQHRYRRKCTHNFGNFFNAAKHNLTKTCDILDVHYQTKPRKYAAWDQKTMFSTSILQEIAFIQNKKEIAHYLLFKEEMKLEAYEKGKTEGTLLECSCCYEDKLSEDMTLCLAGHMYCLNCIKRGSEVVIGNGGTRFPCYSEGCKEEFSFDILKTVLNPEVFSRLLIRKQYEEVNAAGIPGLETCSFCEFCSIPPAEDKLFRCLNPTCMKVTCRSCKKLDHLPLSCEEFTQKETRQKMQSYVEDKMTEALVRTCWQCGTKFVKENGCNMMQCKCGAKMCYFCRQPVENYHHFSGGRCGQFLDTTAHDEAAVIKVGKEAKQEIEAANPGYSLPHDPTVLLLKQPEQPRNYDDYF